jgi:hypothetical protein
MGTWGESDAAQAGSKPEICSDKHIAFSCLEIGLPLVLHGLRIVPLEG